MGLLQGQTSGGSIAAFIKKSAAWTIHSFVQLANLWRKRRADIPFGDWASVLYYEKYE